MADDPTENTKWAEVLAKSTAIVALHITKHDEKSTLEQATFLEALGVSRPEAAALLGVSPTTLYTAHHRARNAKKGARSAKSKSKSKR